MSKGSRVSSFLGGDGRTLERIRSVVEGVVQAFRLPTGGWQEELVQEVLGRVFLSLAHGRFREEASLETYARNVAKFTCLEHLRRQRRQTEFDSKRMRSEQTPWPAPDELLIRKEEHRQNLRSFAALPAECRALFHQVFIEGLSYRQVAERLGVTEGAVRLRVHRCRLRRRRTARTASKGAG